MATQKTATPSKTPSLTIPLNINTILIVALIVAAGAIGHLWTKANYLENNSTSKTVTGTSTGTPTQPSAVAGTEVTTADDVKPISDEDLVRGNRNAKIALIEYSDLECPFCARFHSTAQQIVDEYNGEVAWVYRHFPLDQIHPKATPWAEITECARQTAGNDQAWSLIDAIFADQTISVDETLTLASSLGINQSALQSCVDAGNGAALVETQYNDGSAVGVTGTPGNIILNTETGETRMVPGAVPIEQVKAAIDALL